MSFSLEIPLGDLAELSARSTILGPKREQMAVYVMYHNLPLGLVLYPNAYPNKHGLQLLTPYLWII